MLSFAEGLQLFQAVLFSFQVFWSNIFILQKDKDAKIKGVEVAWEVLARPKQEGGLGLKKLSDWKKLKF